MTEFLSDHLKALRDGMKRHAHGGKRFSSDEIVGLVERLDELVDLARDQELRLMVEPSVPVWVGFDPGINPMAERLPHCRCVVTKLNRLPDNVIAFPGSRPPRHPSGGGSAA